jgi:intracellular multiplication protein IcmJ
MELVKEKYLPLELRASADSWRIFSARKIDKNFIAYEKKVFIRDQYKCRFCGFQAQEHQEIINLDGNFRNNKFENLVTSCVFCAQCYFLESVGPSGFGGGIMIYLPEISQNEINSSCHVLFCAISNNSAYKATAQNIYLNFKLRSSVIEQKFGEGSADPASFGHLLIEAKEKKQKINALMQGVRLLPSRARFRAQIEKWAANAINNLNKK